MRRRDEKGREGQKGGIGKSEGQETSTEMRRTHPEHRVVYLNDTIGTVDVELSIAYGHFLHVILSSPRRESTLIPIPTIDDEFPLH